MNKKQLKKFEEKLEEYKEERILNLHNTKLNLSSNLKKEIKKIEEEIKEIEKLDYIPPRDDLRHTGSVSVGNLTTTNN